MTSSSLHTRASMQAEINVTPLIDVMLALVVVFMIAAPLVMHRLTLPLASESSPVAAAEPVRLHIAANGAMAWNGDPMPAALLRENLRSLAATKPQPELRIEVDPAASYQMFADALADAKAAEIAHIGVMTATAER